MLDWWRMRSLRRLVVNALVPAVRGGRLAASRGPRCAAARRGPRTAEDIDDPKLERGASGRASTSRRAPAVASRPRGAGGRSRPPGAAGRRAARAGRRPSRTPRSRRRARRRRASRASCSATGASPSRRSARPGDDARRGRALRRRLARLLSGVVDVAVRPLDAVRVAGGDVPAERRRLHRRGGARSAARSPGPVFTPFVEAYAGGGYMQRTHGADLNSIATATGSSASTSGREVFLARNFCLSARRRLPARARTASSSDNTLRRASPSTPGRSSWAWACEVDCRRRGARGLRDATEEPTPRRLAEARRRGEVAVQPRAVARPRRCSRRSPCSSGRRPALVGARRRDAARVARGGRRGRRARRRGLRARGLARAAHARAGARRRRARRHRRRARADARPRARARARRPRAPRARPASWRRLFDGRAALAVGQGLLKVALVGAVAALALRPVAGAVVALTGAPARAAPRRRSARSSGAPRRPARGRRAWRSGAADALLVARRHRRGPAHDARGGQARAPGVRGRSGPPGRAPAPPPRDRRATNGRRGPKSGLRRGQPRAHRRRAPLRPGRRRRARRRRQGRAARRRAHQADRARGGRAHLPRRRAWRASLVELAEGGEIPAELYEAVAEILRVVQSLGVRMAEAPPAAREDSTQAPPEPTIGRGEWKRV